MTLTFFHIYAVVRPQEVLHDWQGTELSKELRPADPKNDDATGVQVVARWAGKCEETSEKRTQEGSQSGNVDPGRSPAAPGMGWSLKRFQVVDSDKVIAQSKRPTWHVCLDQGYVGGCSIFYTFHFFKLRGAIPPHPMHRVTNSMKLADNASNLKRASIGARDCVILACGSPR